MILSSEQIRLVNMKEPVHLVNWLSCIILHVLPQSKQLQMVHYGVW